MRRHRQAPLRPAASARSASPTSTSTISSDAFEGRGPATRAETKTINYIADAFRAAGVQPGGDVVNGQRELVPERCRCSNRTSSDSQFALNLGNGQTLQLTQGNEIALRAPLNGQSSVNLANVPLVFVGYGVSAPERNWDDFKGVDVRGKLIVVLINDPDFEGGEGDFGGKAMTYYGRWTYKYEEAARRGAAGVLIVHETDPASYGWNTVKNQQHQHAVRHRPRTIRPPRTRVFESWIQRPLAEQIFAASGLNFDQAKAARGPAPSSRFRSRRRSAPMRKCRSRRSHRTMWSAICRARNIPTRR